jgi:hypothetical protein
MTFIGEEPVDPAQPEGGTSSVAGRNGMPEPRVAWPES